MSIIREDDKKEPKDEPSADAGEEASLEVAAAAEEPKPSPSEHPADDAAESLPAEAPAQLGYRRFVYAAYFAGAIAIAFLASKLFSYVWLRFSSWKPAWGLGEPRDEMIMPAAAVIGALAAFYYWRRTRARKLAEEVASELSKVTWPGRTEVTNSTAVVIVATLVSTIFFFLMDRFWGYITDAVYKM